MVFDETNEIIPTICTVTKSIRELSPVILNILNKSKAFRNNERDIVLDKLENMKQKSEKLELIVNFKLPLLTQLIKDYSRLLADIRIARSMSDKASELINIVPDLGPNYVPIFINQIQNDSTRIETGIQQLPKSDTTEWGVLINNISVIRDLVRDLKKFQLNDAERFKDTFDNISTYLSDIEPNLTKLLERLLSAINPIESVK